MTYPPSFLRVALAASTAVSPSAGLIKLLHPLQTENTKQREHYVKHSTMIHILMLPVESTSDSNNYLFIHNKQTLVFRAVSGPQQKVYRDFPYNPCPHMHSFPTIINIPPTRVRHLLKSMNLQWLVITIQSHSLH